MPLPAPKRGRVGLGLDGEAIADEVNAAARNGGKQEG